jgi:hypothetical protein
MDANFSLSRSRAPDTATQHAKNIPDDLLAFAAADVPIVPLRLCRGWISYRLGGADLGGEGRFQGRIMP